MQSLLFFLHNTPTYYFFKTNLKGEYTYVNDLYKNHFGEFLTHFIGESSFQCIYEADREYYISCLKKCIDNPAQIVEVNYRKAGKTVKFVYIKINFFGVFNDSGQLIEIAALGYNTTEQSEQKRYIKKTQRNLQAILSSSDEAFYFLDPDLHVLSFNIGARNAARSLLGVDIHEGIDFKKQLLLPGTEENFLKQFYEAVAGNETAIESEMDFPNGKKVWYKLSMKPVYDEKDRLRGVAVSFINIDIIKKSEKNLREIAWHQSHLVRKPLTNILGLVNLLKDENNLEDRKIIINLLEESALELDDVVKHVVSKTSI